MTQRAKTANRFSFLELLIVVTLLAILGATLVPQFTAAHEDARQAAVAEDLDRFRRQLDLYRTQHGHWPAEGTNSEAQLIKQLRSRTTSTGVVHEDGKYGPYLIGEIPANPFNHSNKVLVVPGPLKPHQFDGQGVYGWAYSSTTGEFRVNWLKQPPQREAMARTQTQSRAARL